MERVEGRVLGGPEETVAFYARLTAGERVLREQRERVRFTVMLADGSHVRVRATAPRIGPTESLRGPWSEVGDRVPGQAFASAGLGPDREVEVRGRAVRTGDRVALEGSVERGKRTEGYRGPATDAPVAIDAIAIGVGDDATTFLDDEVERRERAALLQELRTLRTLGPKVRRPLWTLAVGVLLLLLGVSLDAFDVPAAATRYFATAIGLLATITALFLVRLTLGWTHGADPSARRSGGFGLLFVVGMVVAMLGLDVAGGAASHGRIGMATVPLTGLCFVWITWSRGGEVRDSFRWADRATRALLFVLIALGAFFTVRNVAQDHYRWEARVVGSDRPDVSVGDTCEVSVSYAPKGFASSAPQCETELTCGGQTLYGESQGFVRCERRDDGFHGADHLAHDGDGVITLEGTSGHSDGVVFEGPPFEP
jgi:hypothetical protein